MEIFDLHSHPVVKTLFKEQSRAISAWPPFKILRNVNAMDSQSSLDQLCDAKMNLICFTRNAVERGMVDQWLLRLVSPFIYQLDRRRLINMAHGNVNYAKQLNDEWTNLFKPPDGQYPNQKVVALKILSDYKKNDKGTLYLIFNVEGGHIFNDLGKVCEEIDIKCIREILDKLQIECPMIFYFTPAHLTPNNLINHAYGNKILSQKPFIPDSYGICPTGWQVIEELYGRNILIDIKHMSLISRMQFYARHEKDFADKPVIASHVGFTGLSLEKLKDTVTVIRKANDFVKIEQPASEGIVQMKNHRSFSNSKSSLTAFNPNSINLYDEDIEYILKSGGLMGLIFDVRILGAAIKDSVTEFISKPEYIEWQSLFHVPDLSTLSIESYVETNEEVFYAAEDVDEYLEELDLFFPDEDYEKFSAEDKANKEEEHLLHFINHLLYLIVVCTNRGIRINPWKQVCIGTDYDGLIAPMYCCKDATFFAGFAEKLKTRIPLEAAKAKLTMPTADIDEFIKDLFFDNAFRLVCDHFK